MAICEFCGLEHDGKYGSGRFCCSLCARKFSFSHVTEEGRNKQRETLNNNRNSAIAAMKQYYEDKKKSSSLPFSEKTNFVGLKNDTMRVGKLGEIATIKKFIENDTPVYIPIVDNARVDLVADFGGKLQKIQVKSSSRRTSKVSDNINFSLQSAGNKFSHGTLTAKKRSYSSDDVDYFALYDCNHDEVYLLKNDEDTKSISLSYQDNHLKNSNMRRASDYQIDTVLDLIKECNIHPDNIIVIDNDDKK